MKKIVKSFLEKIYLPGFEGLQLFQVLTFFFKGIQKGSITTRASAVAFNTFLALFPAIIFLFTLIPFIPIHNFQFALFDLLKEVMPKKAFVAAEGAIIDIVHHQHRKLLSIGFISALYFSTNGVHSMIDAFNKTYHQIETRSFIRQRLVSIALVLITTALLMISLTFIFFSEMLIRHLPNKHNGIFLIQVCRFVVVSFLFFTVISFNFYIGPANKQGWKFISAGSTLATILSMLTTFGFAYYANNFGNYNKLYGSIGTLLIVLLWIYFNCLAMLFGFELNASIRSVLISNSPPDH